jgi:anthranilate phosphoribosyltransferase
MIASDHSFQSLCRHHINCLLHGENLTATEVESLFDIVFADAETSISQEESVLLTAFLMVLASKGETVQTLVGAVRSMRHHARRIQVLGSPVVDIVGTGGDSTFSINVSTAAAFAAAGAGLIIAKHGNRAVSSRCGSADVLEACGVNLQIKPERVEEIVAEIGIGFLFAPQFHPAMRRVAPLRKSLGLRTLFNLLGPLTNPAGANYALIGVHDPKLTEMFAGVLKELGCKRAMVVYGYDGMDELTTTTRSRVTECFDGHFKTYDFFPELYFDGELAKPADLKGGDAAENAQILKRILSGGIRGGKRNIVLLNTAAALVCAEKASGFEEGLILAADSIDSGAAMKKLNQLIEKSQS